MSDGANNGQQLIPRPVDSAIAAEWRSFFASGRTFALPAAIEINSRKRRSNGVFLTVLGLLAAASACTGIALLVTASGRALTYVLLVVVLVLTVIAGARILGIRRALNAVRDAPEEYLAVSRDGIRYAGVDFPWTSVVGGLVIDERHVHYSGVKRLTAKVMRAAGHSRVELLLGVQAGTVREYRAKAPGAVQRTFFVSMGSGGPRVPLQYAIDADSIDPFATAVRVSAADADVPIIVSTDPAVMHPTIMSIWRGQRPGEGKDTV